MALCSTSEAVQHVLDIIMHCLEMIALNCFIENWSTPSTGDGEEGQDVLKEKDVV